MDPEKQFLYKLQRFDVFLRDVIEPAVYAAAHPLQVEAHQCVDPIPFQEAISRTYSPVRTGWVWGPVWSTCWFRVRGSVPREMANQTVVLRFSTDTEALVWLPPPRSAGAAAPLQGLDVNRDAVRLFEPAAGGETIELYVEAACNHLFGDRGLQWDPPEVHRRWQSATPGRLDRCELAVLDEAVWRLRWVYAFALQLVKELPHGSPRARQLFDALRACTNRIPDDDVAAAAAEATRELESVVRMPASEGVSICHAVGHAHIDTAWLWPIRETKRKCQRTFATALRNMERFPEFRFLCSQAQQYAWLEETSPPLFAQLKQRVLEGRWEPGGAMWIEPDCTAPSGEALIRQILHADRYWRSRFGDAKGRQRFLYLPDTFGFPAQLPQIMRLAGLDTFITNKLHWNDTNPFPFTTFIWRGLDGSEVVAHNTPGMDYNATNTPRELSRGEKTLRSREMGSTEGPPRWLQPFGFGDGGGGPTDWNILNAELAADCEGLPRVRASTVGEFCDALQRDIAAARADDPAKVPVHEGELYLELHRGTYTTHARIKQANGECEELLRQAEILMFAGPSRLSGAEESAARAELDRAWKLLLLNQFHDILPGSSIGWVYEDAARDYEEIRRVAQRLIDRGMRHWSSHLNGDGFGDAVCVFNLSNGSPGAYGVVDGELLPLNKIAPMSVRVIDWSQRRAEYGGTPLGPDDMVHRDGLRAWNSRIAVEFDDAGRLADLRSESGQSSAVSATGQSTGPGSCRINQLVLYEDRPRLWDAWDIDAEYIEKAERIDGACERTIVHDAPERLAIRFSRSIGRRSRLSQTFTMLAHSGHIDVETEVDWQENHRLLRVLFPIDPDAPHVELGTQFGSRQIATDRDGPVERAAFELPFHRFISDQVSGLTVVFPDRHGASVNRGVVGVSLLRSPTYPDPNADRGLHRFRYAISPTATITRWGMEADAIMRPLRLGPRPSGTDRAQRGWKVLETGLTVEAIKPAAEGDGLIVRLLNDRAVGHGRCPVKWQMPVTAVEPVDALERPIKMTGFEHRAAESLSVFPIRGYEVVTLAVTRAEPGSTFNPPRAT